ncbi:hypothetical protein BGX27_005159 [Mortierella sp. AM989]|nr:hypothetical protein BGX27_005159 [Mortierella sp. AM989]
MPPLPDGQTIELNNHHTLPSTLTQLCDLISGFETGNSEERGAILTSARAYISESTKLYAVLVAILKHCRTNYNKYEMHVEFLKALLESHHERWTPAQLAFENSQENPVLLSLKNAKEFPRAIILTQTTIEYYIRLAKEKNDLDIASPVLSSMSELIKLKELYPDLVHGTIRSLTFIPVKDPFLIVDNAVIAHPFRLRLKLWRPDDQPIYKCKNPVFHENLNPSQTGSLDPRNREFTHDIFTASFDMLWQQPTKPAVCRILPQQCIQFLYVLLYKFRIRSNPGVKCHAFSPEMLENPAITALIDYKWYGIALNAYEFCN